MIASDFLYRLLCRREPFYVISHERSGTHFAINTLFRNTYVRQKLTYVGDWLGPYERPETRFQHLEAFSERWPTVRLQGGIIKSHCDAALFAKHFPAQRVLYILRDPRDTLVSFFHYLKAPEFQRSHPELGQQAGDDFSHFLRAPLSEYLEQGFFVDSGGANVAERWAKHVSGWLAQPKVYVIRYEDLKRDFRRCVRGACWHVGLVPRLRQAAVGLREAVSVLPRKGEVGDWRSLFRAEDEEFLAEVLRRWGLEGEVRREEGT